MKIANPMRLMLVSALLAWATAADAREAKSKDFAEADAPNKAFVLFSTSAPDTSVASGSALKLERIPNQDDKKKIKYVDGFSMDNPFVKSHSSSERMNVHWRAIPPGDYAFSGMFMNPFGCFRNYDVFRFSVTAGQTLYLGDFRVVAFEITLGDNYSRDLEYFTAHAGGMKPAAFTPALPEREIRNNPNCTRH
jgi:hypothetical protein